MASTRNLKSPKTSQASNSRAGSKAQTAGISHGGVWLNPKFSPVSNQAREKGMPVPSVESHQPQSSTTNRLVRIMAAALWRRIPYPTKRAATVMLLGLPAVTFVLVVWLVSLLAKGL